MFLEARRMPGAMHYFRRLNDADVLYCLTTDNPAFNGRYSQAKYELALKYDLINFQRPGDCQQNAFPHAFCS